MENASARDIFSHALSTKVREIVSNAQGDASNGNIWAARKKAIRANEKRSLRLTGVAALTEGAVEATPTDYAIPEKHGYASHQNPLEPILPEIRRRGRAGGRVPLGHRKAAAHIQHCMVDQRDI